MPIVTDMDEPSLPSVIACTDDSPRAWSTLTSESPSGSTWKIPAAFLQEPRPPSAQAWTDRSAPVKPDKDEDLLPFPFDENFAKDDDILHNFSTPLAHTKTKSEGSRFSKMTSQMMGAFAVSRLGERNPGNTTPLGNQRMVLQWEDATPMQRLTRHWVYELTSALAIVFNAAFVAIATQHRAEMAPRSTSNRVPQELYATVLSLLFSILFMADLTLRFAAEPQRFLTKSRERAWNIFDVVVVFTGVLEAFASAIGAEESTVIFLRQFSVLRIVRLLRVIRMRISCRLMWFIRELRLMVFSLTGAVRALMWSAVLLAGILLVFGVFFTDGAVVYCVRHSAFGDVHTEELRRYFGTLSLSMLSLFMSMSGGEDWINVMSALAPLSAEYIVAFLVFVTVALLAFLNVITAVFIETAMQQAQNDKELMVQQELADQENYMSIMREVYNELDTNNNGEVSFDEFHLHINDARIQAYLQRLELDASQIQMLFKLLDTDRSGGVEAHEFVSGCMKLRGQAKAVDVAFLTSQVNYILESLVPFLEKLSTAVGCALPPTSPPFSDSSRAARSRSPSQMSG